MNGTKFKKELYKMSNFESSSEKNGKKYQILMRISKFEFKSLLRIIRNFPIFDLTDKIRSIFSLKSFGHKIKAIFFQIELNWDGVGTKWRF